MESQRIPMSGIDEGTIANLALRCPACCRPVQREDDNYQCNGCKNQYPIIYGIPDFRLRSDDYLTLEAERSKAIDLAAQAQRLTFEDLVDYYYSITDDVPPELSATYKRSILNGPEHVAELAEEIAETVEGTIIDVGCGAGSLLLALAASNRNVIGVDIALRWLVMCRKRLIEAGLDPLLICTDVTQHPFEPAKAQGLVALDVIEHTRNMPATAQSLAELLVPGGHAWLTVSNRYTLGPHASTRLWGVTFLPKRTAGRFCKWIRGVNSLRNVHLTTPCFVKKLLKREGFSEIAVRPRRIASRPSFDHPFFERLLMRLYRAACRSAVGRTALIWTGPVAEIHAVHSFSSPQENFLV